MKKTVPFLLFVGLLSAPVMAQRKLIHCGTLIDGVNNTPKTTATIVVEKNKIAAAMPTL